MKKIESKHIAAMFDDVDFIEKLEQLKKNCGTLSFSVSGSTLTRGCHFQMKHEAIAIPKRLSDIMFDILLDIKEDLKKTLDNMVVTVVIDPSEDEEPEGEDEEPEDDDDDDNFDE